MKVALALLRSGSIFLQGYSQTTDGVWVGVGPIYVAPETDAVATGRNAMAALVDSTNGIRHPLPQEWKGLQAPMLKAVGVKSWSQLAKGARAINIELENDVVTLTPIAEYEKQGGHRLPDKRIECPPSANDLGRQIAATFQHCS